MQTPDEVDKQVLVHLNERTKIIEESSIITKEELSA
jgi:hypothetical protein